MGAPSGKMPLLCDPCTEDGKQIEAVGYCKDCADFLCASCYEIHRRPKVWRTHQLLKKDEMPDAKLMQSVPDDVRDVADQVISFTDQGKREEEKEKANGDFVDDEESCTEHSGKTVEYYCEEHKVLGCSVCMTLNHRLCVIKYLPSDPSQIMEMLEYKSLKNEIDNLNELLQESLTKTEGFQKQIGDMAGEAVKDIGAFRNLLIKELDKSQKVTLAQVKKMKTKDQKYIEGILNEYKLIETALKETQKDLDNKEQSKCPIRQMYVALRHGFDAVQEYKMKLNTLNEKNTGIVPYKFQPSDTFLNMFMNETKEFGWFIIGNQLHQKQPNLSDISKTAVLDTNFTKSSNLGNEQQPSVGNAEPMEKSTPSKMSEAIDGGPQSTLTNSDMTGEGHARADGGPTMVPEFGQYITEVNVKSVYDTQTSVITGITKLDNQKIAACDFGNQCIKIIDIPSLKLELRMPLASAPYAAAFTGKELVVTQPRKGTLAIFTDIKELKTFKNISVGAECSGIAYQDGKLFISFNTSQGKIRVQKISGEVLRTFTTVGGDSFHHPCHLAVHQSLPKFYVSDWQVLVLGFDGSLVRKHRELSFKELKGLTVTDNGDVYVCDAGRNSVFCVSPMVAETRTVLGKNEGITRPLCVLITGTNQKRMFVSMDKSDVIKVFKI